MNLCSLFFSNNDLGAVVRENLFQSMEPSDLAIIPQIQSSTKGISEFRMIWSRIASLFDYSIDEKKSLFRNYNDFVKDLVLKINKFPEDQVPSDILDALDQCKEGTPSIKQTNRLRKFVRARDALVFWRGIAKQLGREEGIFESLDSADAYLSKAKEFAFWMNKNRELLKKIEVLKLNNQQLASIPEELRFLVNLRILFLHGNQLTNIPEELGKLSNLVRLSISSNFLTEIPDELGDLLNLKWLSIHNNRLKGIPAALGKLSSLERLSLQNNDLVSVPKELGQLSQLKTLRMESNQLDSLPKELGEGLPSLKVLSLKSNLLESIPQELGLLPNLESLNLSQNSLISIPEELGQLSKLKRLYLDHNRLTVIPEKLKRLQVLTLDNNPLSSALLISEPKRPCS